VPEALGRRLVEPVRGGAISAAASKLTRCPPAVTSGVGASVPDAAAEMRPGGSPAPVRRGGRAPARGGGAGAASSEVIVLLPAGMVNHLEARPPPGGRFGGGLRVVIDEQVALLD